MGLGAGSEALSGDFNPLERYAGDVGPLPKIVLAGPGRRAARPLHHQPADHARRHFAFVQIASGRQKRLDDPLQSLMAARRPVGHRLGGKGRDQRAREGRAVCETGRGRPASRRQVRAARALSGRTGDASTAHRDPAGTDRASRQERAGVETERTALAADRAELEVQREGLTVERQALEDRLQQLETRETKFREAQQRLAAEWDRLHADRAALTALGVDLAPAGRPGQRMAATGGTGRVARTAAPRNVRARDRVGGGPQKPQGRVDEARGRTDLKRPRSNSA